MVGPNPIASVSLKNICLFLMVDKAEFVEQFRPISLCNSLYKVVSKVIVQRLKDIVPIVVSHYQTGFVPWRRIQENIFIARKMGHSMTKMRGKNGFFAIKAGLSKSYDKLS